MTYSPAGVIDADAHVIENDDTWDFLEPAEAKYRPKLVPDPTNRDTHLWEVDGKTAPTLQAVEAPDDLDERAQESDRRVGTPGESRRLQNVSARLDHMDALGIDIQVLHTTMWIHSMTLDPDAEAALTRSWNKWLAEIWKVGGDRLPWSCLIPTLMPDEAVNQMRFARENGAVALTFRPFEGDRVLTDPHFYPIFEEAERLDMAMALHIANGSRPHAAFLTSAIAERRAWAFSMFRVPTVNASLILMLSEVPALFPKLRWAFIEAAAQWMPWIFNETARRLILTGQPAPADLFEQNNIYVTCQTDDDLPWVLKYAGENSLMIGTDYGHKDPSSDIDATMGIRDYEGIGDATKDNILYHNPKRLYGLKLDT